MLFGQAFPVLMSAGVLGPVNTDLVVDGVTAAEAVAANEIVQFDFTLRGAGSDAVGARWFDATSRASSAFGLVREVAANAPASGLYPQAMCVHGMAVAAIGANGTGSVRVIGVCNPTQHSSLTVARARGQALIAVAEGGVGVIQTIGAPSATWANTGTIRRIIGVTLEAAANGRVFLEGTGSFGSAIFTS